jgi:hypothetical protein
MTTLFHAEISGRDFASHLLHVGDLLEWAKSKRLHLKTTPPVNDFEFVQVEALLCAIERNANNLTTDEALEIVLNDPILKSYPVFQKYPDDIDPTTCRWLIGANAHKKWRELLTGAIAAHELTLLDFGSKLPIYTATAQTATPAPVADSEWKQKAKTRALQIIKESRKSDLYPNQENLGDRIAAEFRKDGIVGADGKPLTGATIKRHALKGISSATSKQLSTTIGRGK